MLLWLCLTSTVDEPKISYLNLNCDVEYKFILWIYEIINNKKTNLKDSKLSRYLGILLYKLIHKIIWNRKRPKYF